MSSSDENKKMTSQAQALVLEEIDQRGSVDVSFDVRPVVSPADIDEEQTYRASAYALIAMGPTRRAVRQQRE